MTTTRTLTLGMLFTFFSLAGSLSAGASKGKLMKQAGVTRAEAQKIALSQVPDGKVVTAELEKEHGHLVWSFDISRPGRKEISELQVDAKSGRVVSNKIETPKEQAQEARHEKAH